MRRLMVFLVMPAVLMAVVFWVLTIPRTVSPGALGPHTPNLNNGKTMFYAGGCAECHAMPGQDEMKRLGGGLGLKSPFGTFYVPNISSDPNDGIGGWSEVTFVTAMTKGTSPDSEHYYPAFPYTSFQRITFDDLRDLFAYLRTLPAVQGRVRGHDLRFPFNIRRGLGFGNFCSLTASHSSRIQPSQRHGTVVRISSTGQLIAASAIVPAMCSEALSQANALLAAQFLRARAGPPTSLRKHTRFGLRKTSPTCSKLVKRRMASQ